MGVENNITHDKLSVQGKNLGKKVEVCFRYNREHIIAGTIVRDDIDGPFITIIKLDDNRYILDSECQYRII